MKLFHDFQNFNLLSGNKNYTERKYKFFNHKKNILIIALFLENLKDFSKSPILSVILSLKNLSTLSNIFKDLKKEKMHKMSTPTTYPLYVKPSPFWGYNAYYLDSDSIYHSMSNREPTFPQQDPKNIRQIGSITYYTALPTTPTPPTTQNIYTLANTYVEETTDPHIYIFYKKYKFAAVITLDDPDALRHDVLTLYCKDASLIQSTTAVIFNCEDTAVHTYEQHRISLFDTSDRINYRNNTTIKPLGYNAILREDLLPPNQTVWNNHRFCKFSESDSSKSTYIIDENDLKVVTILFIADKKTNDARTEIISDTDFTDIVASYLDDDTSDNLAIIKPSNSLAYTDKKILKSETFYSYKGELING